METTNDDLRRMASIHSLGRVLQYAVLGLTLVATLTVTSPGQAQVDISAATSESPAPEDPASESPAPEGPATERRGEREASLFVRASVEQGRVGFHYDYHGSYSAEGAATRFWGDGSSAQDSKGGRLEGGFAIPFKRGFGLVPRVSLTVMRVVDTPVQVDVAALEHQWKLKPWWVAIAAGGELQMLERMLGLSVEVGLATLQQRLTVVRPATLDVNVSSIYGALGRVGASLRLPSSTKLGVGVTASAETLWNPFDDLWDAPFFQAETRLALGAFIEWDESRK